MQSLINRFDEICFLESKILFLQISQVVEHRRDKTRLKKLILNLCTCEKHFHRVKKFGVDRLTLHEPLEQDEWSQQSRSRLNANVGLR